MSGDLPDPSGMCALVVDENDFARRISMEQLRTMGFARVSSAATLEAAWSAVLELNPDIILIEWSVSGADGLEFVRRIRWNEDAPNRAVSIFMLTSRGAQADVEAARRAGVSGYLRKPISSAALGVRVKRVIERPQAFVTTATYTGPCRRRKKAANFNGPWRRLDDTPPLAADEDEIDLRQQLTKGRIADLLARVNDLAPGDAHAARALYGSVRELAAVAEQIEDPCLLLGAREMGRYVEALGATDRLNREIVQTHVAALQQLAQLPYALARERDDIAQSLKRMIDKKLRQSALG